ncbi:baculoviral IAP repeat-containing protein 7-like [Dermacentor silvarum]|uniref:baculoviral IAP repeat-containing protein 7-like n=1 Tax=Dermacentor silvarum TaxID=543639 RepID=UPI002100A6E9|nr:baculoviral IAP repeat-containing protein 7-like [Dermacentor silvarum]
MARAGFYFMNQELTTDVVKCVVCKGALMLWCAADDPIVEHAKHFPNCAYINELCRGQDVCGLYDTFGIVPIVGTPLYPQYSTLESRVQTFSKYKWNNNYSPSALALAGFLFTGYEDLVKCYFCGGALCDWKAEDIAWEEHAKWLPLCNFILMMKGNQYVNKCRNGDKEGKETLPIHRLPSNRSSIIDYESEAIMWMESRPIKDYMEIMELSQKDVNATLLTTMKVQNSGFATIKDAFQVVIEFYHGIINKKSDEDSDANEEEKNTCKLQCKVCMENEANMAILPCGHMSTCIRCISNLSNCPICRNIIKGVMKIFLS